MNEKQYNADVEKLRSTERIRILEVDRVVDLCLSGSQIKTVLDVGCGTGFFSEAFAMKQAEVTGIDSNLEMIEAAGYLVPGIIFKQGTAESLPFPDSTFDLIFLGHVLHESDDPMSVLKEAKRVSKSLICILEWPHRKEPHGPPLDHRLTFETIGKWISDIGFRQQMLLRLAYMDFYKLFV